jgi:hypothetical protein
MAAPHVAALRPLPWRPYVSRTRGRYARAVTGMRIVPVSRQYGNPWLFCGGVSSQFGPRRQALWAPASWLPN